MAEKRFEPFFGKKLPEVLELEGIWRELGKQDLDCKHNQSEVSFCNCKDKAGKAPWIYGYWDPPSSSFLNWFSPKSKESSKALSLQRFC